VLLTVDTAGRVLELSQLLVSKDFFKHTKHFSSPAVVLDIFNNPIILMYFSGSTLA
jgi:hypothetical protein